MTYATLTSFKSSEGKHLATKRDERVVYDYACEFDNDGADVSLCDPGGALRLSLTDEIGPS